jgi:hypothetical protein
VQGKLSILLALYLKCLNTIAFMLVYLEIHGEAQVKLYDYLEKWVQYKTSILLSIYCDNKLTIAITNNPPRQNRTKYIEIKY